jgi:hypothetical protein
LADVTRILGPQACTNLSSKVLRFLKLPRLAGEATHVRQFSKHSSLTVHLALPPPSKRGDDVQYPAIHWLNDDILLGIFKCYRLYDGNWNVRLGWCKLSHVCQRWRHLIYESAFYMGMHIECTNGSPIVDTLDHLPPLPLFVDYRHTTPGASILPKQDVLGIYHALRLHDRVHHIDLDLPPPILHKALVLMNGHFPTLEHLSLSLSAQNSIPFTLPKAFLAPNLRHLTLPGISPPRRLRMLTSTVSLVTLAISNIQTSGYFRPRVLIARLSSIPQLEELDIGFSIPIPRPSAERELLGEERAPVTLPSLKKLSFKGVSAYLESLVAQIRVPLLERLDIALFNQITIALPHLFHLINTTEVFKPRIAAAYFNFNEVIVIVDHHISPSLGGPLIFSVKCTQLDWQIDCAAQICDALTPMLSSVEQFMLHCDHFQIPTELQNGKIESTQWHDLLRPFIGTKELHINYTFLEELSRALQVDEVGSDPGFLTNLRTIAGRRNLFTSFMDARQAVGRPVKFSR